MWHLQTKIGTFWILNSDEQSDYVLGIDDDILGKYVDPALAVEDVKNQETGCLQWDMSPILRPAPDLLGWKEGQPEHWEEIPN